MVRQFSIVALLTLATATTLAFTMNAFGERDAADTRNVDHETTGGTLDETPGRSITPHQESVISAKAVKALRHIVDARAELMKPAAETTRSGEQLAQAKSLLTAIQAELPTTIVRDRLWIAKKHLDMDETQEVVPDLVPIYASLDDLEGHFHDQSMRAHLDNAAEAMKSGDKAAAQAHLDSLNETLLYVEADMPLDETRQLVTQAIGELQHGKPQQAAHTLRMAEQKVMFISLSFDSPLTRAKTALWSARQAYAANKPKAAHSDLDNALVYLRQAAHESDDITREGAMKLIGQLTHLQRTMATENRGLSRQLEGILLRAKALSDRFVEAISTGWQRLRHNHKGKRDLIEAKLQLAYAEADHRYADDNVAAEAELNRASGYLNAARDNIPSSMSDQLASITQMVEQLRQSLQTHDNSGRAGKADTFITPRTHLATMIGQL